MTVPRPSPHRGFRPLLPLSLLLALTFLLLSPIDQASAYHPLDPLGNVTIVWDVIEPIAPKSGSYRVNVTVKNWQQFQTISNWSLSWTWPGNETINDMQGADVKERGDCRRFIVEGNPAPYNCQKRPTLVDLPKTEGNPPLPGCCKGGLISSQLQNASTSMAVFQMGIQGANWTNGTENPIRPPLDLALNLPGYSCTPAFSGPLSNYTEPGKTRIIQVFQTFHFACTYSKPPQAPPQCCVSFSSFYSPEVVPCANCACACGAFNPRAAVCLQGEDPISGAPFLSDAAPSLSDGGHDDVGEATRHPWVPFLKDAHEEGESVLEAATKEPNALVCSPDGCPLHVRFHVKENYAGYWLAKVTVFNRQFNRNHSDWNLVVQHPSMGNISQVFSFDPSFIAPFGQNNTAAFSGRQGYNQWLLSANTVNGPGVVNSEILFGKGQDFTLSKGWAFPHKVMFGGHECALPSTFPPLPHSSRRQRQWHYFGPFTLLLVLLAFL